MATHPRTIKIVHPWTIKGTIGTQAFLHMRKSDAALENKDPQTIKVKEKENIR